MTSTAEENKLTALAIWGRDLGVHVDPESEEFREHFEKYYTPDYWNHASEPGKDRGYENAKGVRKAFQELFTDAKFEIEMAVAEGDTVVLSGMFTGKHTGLTLYGMPATGRDVSQPHVHILKFRDGKISEHFAVRDDYVMYRQMVDEETPDGGIVRSAEEGRAARDAAASKAN